MRILFLALLVLLVDWLAFPAIQAVTIGLDPGIQQLIYRIFWSVPILTLGYAVLTLQGGTRAWNKELVVFLTAATFILYFSKLLMGIVILVDDLRRVVAWMIGNIAPETGFSGARMVLMGQIAFVTGLVPFLALTYGLLRNPYRYRVFRKDIHLNEIPEALDGLRIVQISDIHAGSFVRKDKVEKSVEIINALQADFVFFTGDLVNHSADEADEYVSVFGKIQAKYGVHSILGNHDYGDYRPWKNGAEKEANFAKLKSQHQRMQWDLLMNTHRVIDVQGASVGVIGVENYSAHPRFPKYGDMQEATHGMPPTDLTILLSHDPSHWDDEVIHRYPDVDLTLSGHTHGFQFGIEITDRLKWSPVQYVYRKWAGLYQQGKQFLYVNRGLGFLGYPGRVGILPEITLLTVRSQTGK